MGHHNSLEVYTSLTVQLLHDIAQCYPYSCEAARDERKIRSRVQLEGLSFLTKTLPKLGKAIDIAISSDTPLLTRGFCLKPRTSIPRFLGWLIERVFTEDGYIRNNPDITALKHLRQLLYFSYKLKIPYDQKTEKSVIDSFVCTQVELEKFEFDPSVEPVIELARDFLSRIFSGFDVRDIIPRHGPGAVATGERVGEKSNFSRIYAHTERIYPFTEYFVLGLNQVADQLDWIQSLEVLEHGTAEVVLVPKDSRGPRLISKEPLELQWIQQGIQKQLYAWIEKHPITKGFVNFTDQQRNRMLALSSSRTNQYVTLDMKDASDRVTLRLVERLFGGTPLLDALLASRSEYTRLPDGTVVRLATFAPMGSAVCFPIEAMCFFALAVAVIRTRTSMDPKRVPEVYVYGDDIIVEREVYPLLLEFFPKVGLRFNEGKCCVGRFFRESCGCDAFDGIDVTPIRMRTQWCHHGRRDASELVSWVELSNSLWDSGYITTANQIQRMVEARYGLLPYVREKFEYFDLAGRIRLDVSPLIGWYRGAVHQSVNDNRVKKRFQVSKDPKKPSYQRLEYKNWVIRPKYENFEVDGWRECLRVLNTGSTGANTGVYALPHRVCLRRGWAPA